MFNVVENLYDGLKNNKNLKIKILVNSQHWTENFNIQRLPNFSIVHLLRKIFKKQRENIFLFKVFLFLLNKILICLDFIFFTIYFTWFFFKEKPDILNIHNGGWPAGWLSRIILIPAKLNRIKVVYSYHNLISKNNFYNKFNSKLLLKFYKLFIDKHVFVSNFLYKNYKFEINKNYTIIYNSPYLKNDSSNFNFNCTDNKKLNIGFIGSISPLKGTIDAIKILKIDIKKHFRLHHIGYIDNKYCLENGIDIKNQNLDYNFYGFQKNIKHFFSKIDVLIAVSEKFESFGLVVVEAMSFGIPVVAKDYGPFKELIENSYNGYLYESQNLTQLYNQLLKYKLNPGLIKRHGKNAKKTYLKRFSKNTFHKKYNKLLFEVLKC